MQQEVDGTGLSREAHLRQVSQTTGEEFENLCPREHELPPMLERLWGIFTDLHYSRQSGFGACAITFSDIWAYAQLYGIELRPWETHTLKQLDMAFLEETAKANQKKRKKE